MFGSHAANTDHARSDYDIAIWLDSHTEGLNDPFFQLYADLPILLGIQDCDLDLVDLRRASKLLKKNIAENHLVIEGTADEILRILDTNN